MQTSLRCRMMHSALPQRAGCWEHEPTERAPSLREQGFCTLVSKRHCGVFLCPFTHGQARRKPDLTKILHKTQELTALARRAVGGVWFRTIRNLLKKMLRIFKGIPLRVEAVGRISSRPQTLPTGSLARSMHVLRRARSQRSDLINQILSQSDVECTVCP